MSLNQQQPTVQTIKKYWAFGLLAFAIAFFIYKKTATKTTTFEAKMFQVEQGWGYEILNNKKVYIHQEIIPAIQGKKNFASKADAEKVANFLIEKIKRKNGLPQITIEEIDSLKISR